MPCPEKSGPGVRIPLSPLAFHRFSDPQALSRLAILGLIDTVNCAKTVPIKLAAERCAVVAPASSFAFMLGPPRFSARVNFGLGILPFVESRMLANGHAAAGITKTIDPLHLTSVFVIVQMKIMSNSFSS
jgi:hypothetical protein